MVAYAQPNLLRVYVWINSDGFVSEPTRPSSSSSRKIGSPECFTFGMSHRAASSTRWMQTRCGCPTTCRLTSLMCPRTRIAWRRARLALLVSRVVGQPSPLDLIHSLDIPGGRTPESSKTSLSRSHSGSDRSEHKQETKSLSRPVSTRQSCQLKIRKTRSTNIRKQLLFMYTYIWAGKRYLFCLPMLASWALIVYYVHECKSPLLNHVFLYALMRLFFLHEVA